MKYYLDEESDILKVDGPLGFWIIQGFWEELDEGSPWVLTSIIKEYIATGRYKPVPELLVLLRGHGGHL